MELIAFNSFKHENEFIDSIEELSIEESTEKAILYLLLLNDVYRQHMHEIYDFKTKHIDTSITSQPWQTESSLKTIRLIFIKKCVYILSVRF